VAQGRAHELAHLVRGGVVLVEQEAVDGQDQNVLEDVAVLCGFTTERRYGPGCPRSAMHTPNYSPGIVK
jgi:hypothetical protein